LKEGVFRAEPLPRRRGSSYAMEYGAFEPPSTIILDSRLPFSDRPLNIPQLPSSLSLYCATHEVIHADDHTGGNRLLMETRIHILEDHLDELEKGMQFIEQEDGKSCINDHEELAGLWALQYVDMLTHYRAFVVLRHKKLPKLDFIWTGLRNDLFPPNLLTFIEQEKDISYIFDIITKKVGEYCLIDTLEEFKNISEKNACGYTV
jgi:hypothetical protein